MFECFNFALTISFSRKMNERTSKIIRLALHIANNRGTETNPQDQLNTGDILIPEIPLQEEIHQNVPTSTHDLRYRHCNAIKSSVRRRLYSSESDSVSTDISITDLDYTSDVYQPPSTSSTDEDDDIINDNQDELLRNTIDDFLSNNHEDIESGNEPTVNHSESEESADNLTSAAPEVEEKRGKKRKQNIKKWKKVEAKIRRNAGQSYISRTGKVVEERKMRPPCSDKCRLKCSTKIPEDQRTKIFSEYWKMGELQRQRDFLSKTIRKSTVKYRRVTGHQPRTPNRAFFLEVSGHKEIQVCKTFLMNTLGITTRMLRTVMNKQSPNGIVEEECRGKHGKHRKIPEEVVESIRSHINSIPRIESHYCRKESAREYIDGELTVAEMYRNYSKTRIQSGKVAAPYHKYAEIFNSDFNIGFFFPKKDQCDLCTSYSNADDSGKAALEEKYNKHVEEKILSRKEKDDDKAKVNRGENMILAVYDLQAVLSVPHGTSSAFFYKSRLNCYNFTVSMLSKSLVTLFIFKIQKSIFPSFFLLQISELCKVDQLKKKQKQSHLERPQAECQAYCYFWHEGIGGRGPNDIGSCVLRYLQQRSQERPNQDVVLYSDNCGGQQKNR